MNFIKILWTWWAIFKNGILELTIIIMWTYSSYIYMYILIQPCLPVAWYLHSNSQKRLTVLVGKKTLTLLIELEKKEVNVKIVSYSQFYFCMFSLTVSFNLLFSLFCLVFFKKTPRSFLIDDFVEFSNFFFTMPVKEKQKTKLNIKTCKNAKVLQA